MRFGGLPATRRGYYILSPRFNPHLLRGPQDGLHDAQNTLSCVARRGLGSTGMELSELRQDRSADFSPLPAVLAGPERGGLKSALLNSMAVGPGKGCLEKVEVASGQYLQGLPLLRRGEKEELQAAVPESNFSTGALLGRCMTPK